MDNKVEIRKMSIGMVITVASFTAFMLIGGALLWSVPKAPTGSNKGATNFFGGGLTIMGAVGFLGAVGMAVNLYTADHVSAAAKRASLGLGAA